MTHRFNGTYSWKKINASVHLNAKERKCTREGTSWIEQNRKNNCVNKSLPSRLFKLNTHWIIGVSLNSHLSLVHSLIKLSKSHSRMQRFVVIHGMFFHYFIQLCWSRKTILRPLRKKDFNSLKFVDANLKPTKEIKGFKLVLLPFRFLLQNQVGAFGLSLFLHVFFTFNKWRHIGMLLIHLQGK